jgi:hypothetical protein
MGRSISRLWPWSALALVGVGAAARLVSLWLSWGKPLGPDASEYVLLAKRYSFAHPWSASYREPFWRAIVKVAIAPFGYSPDALRTFTAVVSIATLPVAWILLRRLADRYGLGLRMPLIAFALVALSMQLVREAPRGLREDTCLLIFLFVAVPLVSGDRSRRAAISVAVSVGLLASIRLELATLALVMCVVFAAARRISPLAPALAAVLLVALAAPWLIANRARHGELFYNSKVHSTFYWKLEQPRSVRLALKSPLGEDPPVRISWSRYYLGYLGPARTVERTALGYPRLLAKLVASQAVPRGGAMSALGRNQNGKGWLVVFAAIGAAFAAALVAASLRVRGTRGASAFLSALALLVLAALPYAPLAAFVELRVLAFAVPLLAVATAIAVDACLPAFARARADDAPAPAAA